MSEHGFDYYKFADYIINAANNWERKLSEQLHDLQIINIDINDYFRYERKMTFDFSSLINDINILQKYLLPKENIDISAYATKLSYAFLPPCVYYLEEYGLPRTISKKIANSRMIELENTERKISEVLADFLTVGINNLIENIPDLDSFDIKILNYFYKGISSNSTGGTI